MSLTVDIMLSNDTAISVRDFPTFKLLKLGAFPACVQVYIHSAEEATRVISALQAAYPVADDIDDALAAKKVESAT